MEENMNKALTLIFVSILLMSCTLLPTPEPTVEPTFTSTVESTETSQPVSTSTTVPTATLQSFDPGAFTTLAVADGFTLSVPFPLLHEVNKNVVIVGNEENTLTISFASDSLESGETLEDVLNAYLGSLEKRGWEFTKSEPVEIEIDHATGILVDLTSTAQSLNFEGQAVAVSLRPGFVLFGLGLFEVSANPEGWKNTGEDTFKTLMDSIKFTEASGVCPISTDETYGYSEANPIKVGGDFISGVSRERAYLDHLRGPNGETLSYERQGSTMSGDVILDIYHITGSGVDETLYVDLYNFSELSAPVGFTCNGPFPLSAP
jgi:hypothetical protein